MSRVVYLDNNATTRVAEEVVEALLPFYAELYGNPSSMHAFGGQVARHIAQAREQVAAILGADPTEILFVSCGSESDNMAIRGVLEANPDKRHVISTRVEHPAVLSLCNHLRKRGYEVTLLGVDGEGRLDLAELRNTLRADTAVVSVMYANNETGVVFPIEEIGQIVKAHGAAFHVDAVQAVGKLPLDMAQSTIDLLSLSGHKLHAPKGVGVLYIRKGVRLVPLIIGGHQERNRRGGTENVASIVGLGRACELARAALGEENDRVRRFRDKLEDGILRSVPNVRVNGDREHRLPNTTSISFEYIEGEAILLLLDQLGICASSGSACTSGSLEPSHVLRAMGVPFTASHGSIRFSLSRYNTEAEIDYVLEHLPPLIERLRNISPFWKDYQEQLARQF